MSRSTPFIVIVPYMTAHKCQLFSLCWNFENEFPAPVRYHPLLCLEKKWWFMYFPDWIYTLIYFNVSRTWQCPVRDTLNSKNVQKTKLWTVTNWKSVLLCSLLNLKHFSGSQQSIISIPGHFPHSVCHVRDTVTYGTNWRMLVYRFILNLRRAWTNIDISESSKGWYLIGATNSFSTFKHKENYEHFKVGILCTKWPVIFFLLKITMAYLG